MDTTITAEQPEVADLLRRLREACRSTNHSLTNTLTCGYCIEIGEVIGDE